VTLEDLHWVGLAQGLIPRMITQNKTNRVVLYWGFIIRSSSNFQSWTFQNISNSLESLLLHHWACENILFSIRCKFNLIEMPQWKWSQVRWFIRPRVTSHVFERTRRLVMLSESPRKRLSNPKLRKCHDWRFKKDHISYPHSESEFDQAWTNKPGDFTLANIRATLNVNFWRWLGQPFVDE
jgi:hypothetical protein